MTLVNAKCDTVQAKNIWGSQWPFQSCVFCRVSSALNSRTKGSKTIQSSETEGLTKVTSKQGSELPLFHLCRKYLQSVWSNEDKCSSIWCISIVDCWYTVMRHLMTGICSEKCVVSQFRRRTNVTECTYTNLGSTAYYTPRLYGIA